MLLFAGRPRTPIRKSPAAVRGAPDRNALLCSLNGQSRALGPRVNKGSGRDIYREANMGHLADVQPKRVCRPCYRGGSLWRGGLPGEPGTFYLGPASLPRSQSFSAP